MRNTVREIDCLRVNKNIEYVEGPIGVYEKTNKKQDQLKGPQ